MNMNFGALTPEEREYLLANLPDLEGMEDSMQRQSSLADALRTRDRGRMDWASQLGRAIQGGASGYQEYKLGQQRGQRGEALRGLFQGWPGQRRRPEEMYPGQYSTMNTQYG